MDVYRVKLKSAHNDDPIFSTTDVEEARRFIDTCQVKNSDEILEIIARDESDGRQSIWQTVERVGV